ncbi:MAG: repeat-associated core domain protein [Bacteroidetes bacterium]|jgi:RHS repeat-associated protein|nr:repeat-associated core domain protein [Bacteroidota bacterium]MDF2450526.1 repeat-associated core domain protein [Bacteroidota bacterium]
MANYIKHFITGCLLVATTVLYGSEVHPQSGILKSTATNVVTIGTPSAEAETFEPTPIASGIADYNVRNLVILNLDKDNKTFLASPTSVRTKIRILRWDVNGNPMPTQIANLTVTSDNRYSRQTIDQSIFKDVDGYKVKMIIDSIFINGVYTTTLPEYVFLESNIYITRYYQFAGTHPTISSIDELNTDCDAGNNVDELQVNWSTIIGAEEYQLEWTYVNNYGLTSTSFIPMNALSANFKSNSTRITTDGAEQSYRISLTYEKGYIAFRVRAVGRDYLNPDKYIYSDWTSLDVIGLASMPSAAVYYNQQEHEKSKNWQYSATFAEEGKKKEVISYFDGSLHNRQSVTKVNSDKNVIVGETIYDFQGRPAINVLPTPVIFPNCTTTYVEPALKFYPDYNQNMAGKEYSRFDFDIDGTAPCLSATGKMDTLSGSSRYYSGYNPDKTGYQAFVPNAEMYPFSQIEYTPDNTGRIRSQSGVGQSFQLGTKHETKYIYAQPNQIQLDRLFGSEVGDAAHYKKNTVIDANGQASISYMNQEGKTIATSLAGNPPTDASGNIIMEPLASAGAAAVPFTVDAFNKNAAGNSLSNKITPLQDGIEFSTQLSVSYNSSYNFTYNLKIDTLKDPCLRQNYCISCIYDLEIKVTDECGAIVTPQGGTSNPVNKRVGHLSPSPDGFTMNCIAPSKTNITENLNFQFTPGVYTVSKILTINKDARDFYVKNYLDSVYNSCFKTRNQFIHDAVASVDTSSCYGSCSACAAALGTKDDFVSSGKGSDIQYDFLMDKCLEPCRDRTICQNAFEMMLIDVSPGGIYGKIDNQQGTITAGGQTHSVFNTSNMLTANMTTSQAHWKQPRLVMNGVIHHSYLDDNGVRKKVNVFSTALNPSGWSPNVDNTALVFLDNITGQYYTYPENLTYLNDFVPIWNTYFAKSLVMYHPEYAYYIACKDQSRKMGSDNRSSEQFDSLLMVSSDFVTATNNKFIIPGTKKINNWFISSGPPHTYDPILTNPVGYEEFKGPFNYSYTTFPYVYDHDPLVAQMQNKINNYQTINGVPYTMEQIAAYVSRCGNNFYSTPTPQCIDFGSNFYAASVPNATFKNDSIRNKEWETYKNFYISEKRKLQFNRMNFFAKHIANSLNTSMISSDFLGGCNACIGNSSYSPFSAGMYGTPFNSPSYDFSQPCSFYSYYNFTNSQTHQKRFIDPANSGLSTSNVAYQVYQQTGQCPMAFQLQGFLNTMVQGHYFYPAAQVQLNTISAFNPDLYNAVNGGNSPSVFINYKWKVVSTAGNLLTANIINPNTNLNQCTVTLDITGSPITSFTSLQSFQSLSYDHTSGGLDYFKIVATYLTGSNTLATATIMGSSCIDIHGCQFEPQCQPNQFAVDVMNLANVMLANGLATQTNYNISANTTVAPVISATVKNALGLPNNNIIWNAASSNVVEIYDNANSGTKLVFTTISITPSSAAPNIVSYSNIRSNYNNLFKMDGMDINGVKIATLEGKAEKITPTVTKGMSMGECGFPENPDCQLTEHKVRADLEKLLNECLTAKPFTGNINLFTQMNFTSLLQSYFTNTLTSTSSTYDYDNGTTTSFDTLKFKTNNACQFELYHNLHHPNAQPVNFSELTAVSSLTGIPPFDANQNYHDFYFIGTYLHNGSVVKDTVWGKSCFPLKNCTVCDEPAATGNGTKDSIDVLHGKAYFDPAITVYKQYKTALDSLNLDNGWDTLNVSHVKPMSYMSFSEKGYANADEYIKFVKNFDATIDSTSYLEINKFVYKYGNFTNCTKEYDRYAKSINAYNGRAANAGSSLLYPITDSSFYANKLCDVVFEYINYLKEYPIGNTTPKTIYQYFSINPGTTPSPDSCKALYEHYVSVYKEFSSDEILQKACKEANIMHPLYGYDVIEKNNLCCTLQGLTLFSNYINGLANASTSCPPALESIKDCSNPQTDINPKFCHRNYIIFLEKIKQYNDSPYAQGSGIMLNAGLYPTFESFAAAGYCDCVIDYINYLNGYIYMAKYSKEVAPPVDIDHYSGCSHTVYPPVTDSCKILYRDYRSIVTTYNDLAIKYGNKKYPVIPIYSWEEFSAKYCNCAEKFIAGLTALLNGYQYTDEELKTILSLPNSCTPVPCTRTPPSVAFEFPSVPHTQSPCVVQLIAVATQNAINQFNQYRDSTMTSIISRYNAHCLKPFESFEYNYTDKEFHFTLYYYDQAGNLVKTIPPEGIKFLNINSPTSADEIKVQQGRLTNTQTIFTEHRMATTYEYNSLNQLVRQDMPDHDKMDICESTLPNGLDADLVINSVQYVTSSKGYLTGYLKRTIGSDVVNRGYVYTTNDGGQNWARVKGLAGGDMQKIQMVTSSVGYAVSNYGLVFKTLDGGMSWDVLTTLYNASTQYFGQLTDLYFTSATTGIIGGIKPVGVNGGVYKTTDGGLTYAAATGFVDKDTITGLTFDGSKYFASVTNQGIGKIYTSTNGLAWTAQNNFAANDLKRVQYISTGIAYAVGYDGTLLRSTAPTSAWTLVATNQPYKFEDIYFKDASNGVALIEVLPGKAAVYKTFDGGNTWALLSAPGNYYTTIQSYAVGKAIAAGENGLVAKIVMTAPPFGMININGSIGTTTDDFSSADAVFVTSKLPSLVVSNTSNVYFTYDAMVSSPSWTTFNTAVTGGFKKGLIAVSTGASPIVQGIMLGNNGILYQFYRAYNTTPVYTAINVAGTNFTDITCANGNNTPEFYAYDNTSKRVYSVIYSGTTVNALAMTSPGTTQTIHSIDMNNTGGELLIAGANGTLLHGSGVTAANTNINWTTVTDKVKPLPLNDIAVSTAGNIVAVGNDGTQWYTTNAGSNWQLANTGTSQKLNALKTDNTQAGLIAANGGKLYAMTNAVTANPVVTPVNTLISDNLTDVAIDPATQGGIVTTQAGKIIFVGSYNTVPSMAVNPNVCPNGALNGAALVPGAAMAIAVGKNSGVMMYNGAFSMNINEIYTHPLKAVHFYDNNNGYVVDSGYVLRHTNNAGGNWQVVLPKSSLPLVSKVYSTGANKALIIGAGKYVALVNNNSIPVNLSTPTGVPATVNFNDINFNQSGYGVIVGSKAFALSVTASGSSYVIASLGNPTGATLYQFNAVHVFKNNGFMAVGTAGNIYYKPFGAAFVKQSLGIATTDIFNDVYFHDDRVGYAVGNSGKAIKCILAANIESSLSPGLFTDKIVWFSLCQETYLGRNATDVHFKAIAFGTRTQGFLAGSFKNTATTYKRHALLFNDESGLYSTRFWYDKLGRMVISQNTKQFNKIINTTTGQKGAFSYTLYDALGRIVEVGEKYENSAITAYMKNIFGTNINGLLNLKAIDDAKLLAWVTDNTGARREVTKTYYDENIISGLPIAQDNLRKRVASISYEDVFDGNDQTYQHATHYTYDIHGNVKSIVQDNKKLYDEAYAISPTSKLLPQRFKRMNYEYDLISGKVNAARYQDGQPDAFYHFYRYDSDNRITEVYTSSYDQENLNINASTVPENPLWQRDAKYFYYAHGPLARVEYGNDKVQGVDYAYTLQGWVKGVNSNALDKTRDMGQDALAGGTYNPSNANIHKEVAQDAYGYTLNYYQGDYRAINVQRWSQVPDRFEANAPITSTLKTNRYDLYNGNIGSMVTSIVNLDSTLAGIPKAQLPKPLGNAYKYDQLNRLKKAVSFNNIDMGNNVWENTGQLVSNMYGNTFTYDANGNILNQNRRDENGNEFEALKYKYNKENNGAGQLIQNRLYHVSDHPGYTSLKSDDIDSVGIFNANNLTVNINNNYVYDEIGNLVKDIAEQVDKIEWTVYGKIKSITRTSGSTKDNLVFDYDVAGNRVAKYVSDNGNNLKRITYYLRDAQGNVMSVYEQKNIASTGGGAPSVSFMLEEQHLYANSRIGMNTPDKQMIDALMASNGSVLVHYTGNKQFEQVNHLGNVVGVITDKKIPVDEDADNLTDYYQADITSTSDYSAFGVKQYNRGFSFASYRYGFNGKENDKESVGTGNGTQDYGLRIYNPALGKFLSVDPLTKDYPFFSPYQFAGNSPIRFTDMDGAEPFDPMGMQLHYYYMGEIAKKNGEDPVKYVKAQTKNMAIAQVAGTVIGAAIITIPYWAVQGITYINTPHGQQMVMEGTSLLANLVYDGPDDPFPTAGPGGEIGKYFKGLFKTPIADVGSWLKASGVENFKFVKGAKGGMTAVIGQGMGMVNKVAGGLKNALTFTPTKAANEEWNALLKQYEGKIIPDNVVKGTQVFKENKTWIENVKKEGYDILDAGGGTNSTFYNMEKEAVYGEKK